MTPSIPKETLDALFPTPIRAGSDLSPQSLPGITPDSSDALVNLLKENHERFHIFFNDRGFHNHATHHLFAIFSQGATPGVLKAAYDTHAEYQRPAIESPKEITESTWIDHLGDEKYYRGYLTFFSKIALNLGIKQTLEKFVFSTASNWNESIKDDAKQPQMLNRLLSGVLHAFIHAGYACEFGTPGMLVEGLAMACVTGADFNVFIPKSLFVGSDSGILASLSSKLTLSSDSPSEKGLHSFSIVARMLKDPELDPENLLASRESPSPFPMGEVLMRKGDLILKYAEQWSVNTNDGKEVREKIEELSWLATLLYGVSGLQDEKTFNADFFTMHLVTSSIFLPSYLPYLSPSSLSVLLRTYFAISLGVWVARGRPKISISSFYSRTSSTCSPPGPKPTPSGQALTPTALFPNAWFEILQSTLLHPNEHFPKLQRSFAHFGAAYGTSRKGRWSGTELEGAEGLDGTLFVRVASLSMDRLGWVREGAELGSWDRDGFWH